MKHFILITFFLLYAFTSLKAQRYIPGQQGIQFTLGTVDGLNPDKGFSLGLGMSGYNNSGNHWEIGADYMQKQHSYDKKDIPVAQFILEGSYYKQLLSDPSKTVFISVGGSAMAGYETINWGKNKLSDGASITNGDSFLYGGAIALEIETFLTDRLALLINARERMLLGSDISKFHFQFTTGLKCIIN